MYILKLQPNTGQAVTDWRKLEEYRASVEAEVVRSGKFTKGKGKGAETVPTRHANTMGRPEFGNIGKTFKDAQHNEKGQKKGRSRRAKSMGLKADRSYGSSKDL